MRAHKRIAAGTKSQPLTHHGVDTQHALHDPYKTLQMSLVLTVQIRRQVFPMSRVFKGEFCQCMCSCRLPHWSRKTRSPKTDQGCTNGDRQRRMKSTHRILGDHCEDLIKPSRIFRSLCDPVELGVVELVHGWSSSGERFCFKKNSTFRTKKKNNLEGSRLFF
jgi:hypothetical protein